MGQCSSCQIKPELKGNHLHVFVYQLTLYTTAIQMEQAHLTT